jgi:hypothetical protein
VKTGDYHDFFDYSPIVDRPRLTWPNGARVAVWVVPNIAHYELELDGRKADVRNLSHRDYGNRVGIWRLMDAEKVPPDVFAGEFAAGVPGNAP